MNTLKLLKQILLILTLSMLVSCGGSSSSIIDNPNAAQEKIEAYANGSKIAPTIQDYIDAGITGVTTDNLTNINTIVGTLKAEDVDSKEEIQALADQLGVSVNLEISNHPPTVVDQSITINENTANNSITLSGSDIDGDSLSYTVIDQSSHGSLTGSTPNLSYTPTKDFVGNDSFTYKANDGAVDSTLAVISIVVTTLLTEPPVIEPTSLTPETAARFLTQSTFGPTTESINKLVTLDSYEKWLDQQFAEPISVNHKTAVADLWSRSCASNQDISAEFRTNIWWDAALNNPDQLRQRVAFALSEILVISSIGPLYHNNLGVADYYDVLNKHAFGNYRDLLEEVTLHPTMGIYLSMLRNEKADPARNIRPDENYAREVLQLFSIGVNELNLDGSLKQANGKPIPNYDQSVIEGFAKVFTGWNFGNLDSWGAYIGQGDLTQPMKAWSEYHDSTNDKKLLTINGTPTTLSAGTTAEQEMTSALDNIFSHPNVAPFISKQLIQRLITSNPSPAYVQRVAQKFNDNGSGVKGDLKAVVKAILLDDEARTGNTSISNFGKLREPLLRLIHMRRAFDAIPVEFDGSRYGGSSCGSGKYYLYITLAGRSLRESLGQDVLQSPSVFNFFLPDFSPPGVVRDAGLVSPEFQINTENTMVSYANAVGFEIQRSGDPDIRWTTLDLSKEIALASEPEKLLDHLNLLLLNGDMSSELRQLLLKHLNNAVFANDDAGRTAKTKDVIMLIVTSPDFLIQK